MSSPKTLPEWLFHLEALHPKGQAGIELGLDRVRAVKAALGQREGFPVITVGGTNGKGSTCAYLETILERAGCKVGCYASPHLVCYNERIRIGTRPVDDDALCRALARVEAARGDVPLTYFEFGTLAAWEVFAENGVDVAVLEVGLGGRLDAVNAYEPDVSIVTGIALDHVDYLGPTRETIGFEKAGIFRSGKPAICADRQPPATLVEHAKAIGAELMLIGRDFGAERIPDDRTQWRYWHKRGSASQETIHRNLAYPGLRGEVQIFNAAAAVTALDCLRARLPVSMQAVRRGLVETELAGRFQVLPGRPAVVLDVGHNPQACAVLADNLGSMGFFDKTVAIVGMLGDKDVEGSLQALAGKIDHWLLIPLSSSRAAGVDQLAAAIARVAPKASVECCMNAGEAALRASMLTGETDRIVVFGSFLTVGAITGDARLLELLRQARVPTEPPAIKRLG